MPENPQIVDVKSNFKQVLQQVENCSEKVGRDPHEITIVGVSKRIEFERIKVAIDAGLTIIGEIAGTELKKKLPLITNYSSSTQMHIVGKMQSNKVKYAVENCDLIQSIQTEKILSLINRRAQSREIKYPIFIQVDYSETAFPKGLDMNTSLKFIKAVEKYSNVEIQGIMTIAPLEYEVDQSKLRKFFSRTHKYFADKIVPLLDVEKPQLSMGMSNDFDVAIEEGSSMIRVGTAIFGPRN
ncbi:MAG: YggS family pyridoxal phosphate-dependent enzyme [Candidatus Heimdallarchaeota archaeon]|nr:YggS family pyridoxal phosphate-dependent enzyme [Candidatus Heimdallarchaeota archaeon]MCK4769131.1 YggS family pyridoxal phosphate-dependent enzyme [Candidatus Heimdallarchaeota archaeon]